MFFTLPPFVCAALALPSAGPLVFVQSALCNGIAFKGSDQELLQTPFHKALDIIQQNNLTSERIQNVVSNARRDATRLDSALILLEGLVNLSGTVLDTEISEVQTLDAVLEQLPFFDEKPLGTDAVSGPLGPPTIGTFMSTTINEQQVLRQGITGLCSFLRGAQIDVLETMRGVGGGGGGDVLARLADGLRVFSDSGNSSTLFAELQDGLSNVGVVMNADGTMVDQTFNLPGLDSFNLTLNMASLIGSSTPTQDLLEQLDGASALFATGIDVAAVLEAANPSEALVEQLRAAALFIDTTAPAMLGMLEANFPGQIDLDADDVEAVQAVLQAAADEGFNNTVTRQMLEDVLGDVTNVSSAVIASLVGLNSASETAAALDALMATNNISSPLNFIAEIQSELENLEIDLAALEQIERAAMSILEMPAVEQLFKQLEPSSGVDMTTALTSFICPAEPAGSMIPHMPMYDWARRSRRDGEAADEASGSAGQDSSTVLATEIEEDIEWLAQGDSFANTQISELISQVGSNMSIYYSPNTSPEVNAIITLANRTFDQLGTMLALFQCTYASAGNSSSASSDEREESDFAVSLDLWKGFATEEEMVADAMNTPVNELLGAIAFHNIGEDGSLPPKGLEYSIRMNSYKTPKTDISQSSFFRPVTTPPPQPLRFSLTREH